jgi:high-affinity iron transporter
MPIAVKRAGEWCVTFARPLLIGVAVLLILGVFVWQGVTAAGNPDPTREGLSATAMILSAGILVFREGLEAILVLAAVTAGMTRGRQKDYLRAVPLGGVAAFLATIATWFIVVAILNEVNAPQLHVQAATGLIAIIVLLVVMNWFFHKIYWTGWITHHNNRKRRILEAAEHSGSKPFWGLVLLGFTAIYREGFEVVLFLQNLRLRAGNTVILKGAAIGLALTAIVAILTFIAHKRLPYKRMLVWTGILLGVVLLVMVGESVQEMQLAGWLSTTPIGIKFPEWVGLWFAVFPNAEGLLAQGLSALLVLGSYFSAQRVSVWRSRRRQKAEAQSGERIMNSAVSQES